MFQAVHINETTTLSITTKEDWRQAKSENCDLEYIKNLLYGME